MERVRRLNGAGVEAFRAFLGRLREGSGEEPPRELLGDEATSEVLGVEVVVEERAFASRLEVGRYLAERLVEVAEVDGDVGLWSWLSLYWFEQVCPVGERGRRQVGRDYRHILEPGYRYGHRHLLGGARYVFDLLGEEARLLLSTPLHTEALLHHELASRLALISNPGIVRAVAWLYWDDGKGALRRGATSRKIPGSVYRFLDVVQQLEVNFDLYGMSERAILGLLPAEFDRWRTPKQCLLGGLTGWSRTAAGRAQPMEPVGRVE